MKTFTVDEANGLLQQIDELLGEITTLRDQLVKAGGDLESVLRHASGDGGNKVGGEYLLVLQHLNAYLSMLQDLGVELKDLDQGLVDFPSMREGKLVYLCWKRGEDRISFWHDLESGFPGRQPL